MASNNNNKKPEINWIQVVVELITGLVTGLILILLERLIN